MKIIRKTVTAHISKVNTTHIEEWQKQIFDSLKNLLKPYKKNLDSVASTEHHYELWTKLGYRTRSFHVKRNKGIAFASIIIFQKHVAFYFYPLSMSDELNVPDSLGGFRKGKYTFHLKYLDAAQAENVNKLIAEGWSFYKSMHLVSD